MFFVGTPSCGRSRRPHPRFITACYPAYVNTNPRDNRTLAIDGGQPTFANGAFERRLDLDSIERSILAAVTDGQWQQYHGHVTDELCRRLAEIFSCQHVMLCCSGTISVELALRGVGVRAGDEVLIAGYDFPGNFRAIEAIGAFPVLVDVVAGGWTIDAETIPDAISEKTKAIIVSHLHGQVADVDRIRKTIEDHARLVAPIAILEDACQSPGGAVGDRPLGSIGDIATLSFGGSKLLTAGRGGAVLAHNDSDLQRIKIFAERGNDSFPLSQLQAAALLPQLDQLKTQTHSRHRAAMQLCQRFCSIASFVSLSQVVSDITPAYYKFPLRCTDASARDRLIEVLAAEGVPIGEGFRGFVGRSKRRCRQPVALPNSKLAIDQTMLLHHSVLDADSDMQTALIDVFQRAADAVARNR